MRILLWITLFLLPLAFAQGCGGISSRIKENHRQFDTYPHQIQAQIQNGRIDRGFTEEMVYMAKGKPEEKTSVLRGSRTITIWKYARSLPGAPPGQSATNLSTPYGYPGFGPGPSQPAPMFYERRYFKVEFEQGKVIGWDQDFQDDPDRNSTPPQNK